MKHSFSNSLLLLLTFAALLIGGCGGGGGGGGGSTLGTITITTDWTNRANAGGGLSEKFDLYNTSGFLLQEVISDFASNPVVVDRFRSVPAGTYRLSAELWSQPLASGTLTGSCDLLVTIGSNDTMQFDVGNAVTGITVSPPSATFQVQHSKQFYVAPTDASTHFTYMAPGSVAWSVLGGVATIDGNTGIALAQSVGSGSVRATYNPGSVLGAATITTTAFVPTTSKWTVFVYLNGTGNLREFAIPNVLQMQSVAGNPANVRFVVQWKEAPSVHGTDFVGTRRYLVTYSARSIVTSEIIQDLGPNVDMGDPQTMADFLNWGQANFPGTRTCVVGWSHGNGWAKDLVRKPFHVPTRGFSYDDDTGNNIKTWQLSQALGTLQPEILAWDACVMQMAEVAYEARSKVKYVIGGESNTPGTGYPYDLIFSKFRDNPDATTLTLSRSFVDGMLQAYPTSTHEVITQSVIDTTKLPALVTSINALSDVMVTNQASLGTLIPLIRSHAAGAGGLGIADYDDDSYFGREYRDLYDVCSLLKTGVGVAPAAPAAVQTAATNVQAAVQNAVVWNGHNGQAPNSNGISVSFYNSSTYATWKPTYTQLAFGIDCNWKNWLEVSP